MSDMNFRALLGRGRQLLGRVRLRETTDQSAGTYSLLALRLERDLARPGRGHSILVTAADDEAVAVEAAVELAWSLADELGHTVLVVDGTLGDPALSRSLGMADKPGLVELLDSAVQNAATLEARLQATTHERVRVLPHGAVRDLTLRAEAIRAIVATACEMFDFVVIHGSLRVAGGRSLAFGSMVDAALLLAVEGLSTLDDVAHGQRLLNDCGARRVALVLGNRPHVRLTRNP